MAMATSGVRMRVGMGGGGSKLALARKEGGTKHGTAWQTTLLTFAPELELVGVFPVDGEAAVMVDSGDGCRIPDPRSIVCFDPVPNIEPSHLDRVVVVAGVLRRLQGDDLGDDRDPGGGSRLAAFALVRVRNGGQRGFEAKPDEAARWFE